MYMYMYNSDDDESILVLIRPFNNGDEIVNVSMESVSSFLSPFVLVEQQKEKKDSIYWNVRRRTGICAIVLDLSSAEHHGNGGVHR